MRVGGKRAGLPTGLSLLRQDTPGSDGCGHNSCPSCPNRYRRPCWARAASVCFLEETFFLTSHFQVRAPPFKEVSVEGKTDAPRSCLQEPDAWSEPSTGGRAPASRPTPGLADAQRRGGRTREGGQRPSETRPGQQEGPQSRSFAATRGRGPHLTAAVADHAITVPLLLIRGTRGLFRTVFALFPGHRNVVPLMLVRRPGAGFVPPALRVTQEGHSGWRTCPKSRRQEDEQKDSNICREACWIAHGSQVQVRRSPSL